MGRIGQMAWNKGLTKDTDPRVALNGKNESKTKKTQNIVPWNKGLKGKQQHSEETRIKMSQSAKGHTYRGGGPAIGHNVSREVRQQISESVRDYMLSLPKEELKKHMGKMISAIKHNETRLEKRMEELIKTFNVSYEKQKYIGTVITKPDFFVSPNICIYADGKYWHKTPEKIIIDERITKDLKELEYIVLRFPEEDIYKHPEKVLNELTKCLEK